MWLFLWNSGRLCSNSTRWSQAEFDGVAGSCGIWVECRNFGKIYSSYSQHCNLALSHATGVRTGWKCGTIICRHIMISNWHGGTKTTHVSSVHPTVITIDVLSTLCRCSLHNWRICGRVSLEICIPMWEFGTSSKLLCWYLLQAKNHRHWGWDHLEMPTIFECRNPYMKTTSMFTGSGEYQRQRLAILKRRREVPVAIQKIGSHGS